MPISYSDARHTQASPQCSSSPLPAPTSGKAYHCVTCGEPKLYTIRGLRQHLRQHKEPQPEMHFCEAIGCAYNHWCREALDAHILRVHPGSKFDRNISQTEEALEWRNNLPEVRYELYHGELYSRSPLFTDEQLAAYGMTIKELYTGARQSKLTKAAKEYWTLLEIEYFWGNLDDGDYTIDPVSPEQACTQSLDPMMACIQESNAQSPSTNVSSTAVSSNYSSRVESYSTPISSTGASSIDLANDGDARSKSFRRSASGLRLDLSSVTRRLQSFAD